MNFDFSEEQKQLRDQAGRYLADRCPSTAVRRIVDGPDSFDRDLWRGLGDLGFLGAAIPEAYGGLGAGYLELCVIAEELGRSLAPVPMASSIYLAAEFLKAAGSEQQKRRWLPQLASGHTIGTFAMAEGVGRVAPAGIMAYAAGGRLNGVKAPVADGDIADLAIVAARTDGGGAEPAISLFLVDLNDPGVLRETLSSIDPTRSQARLVFDGAAAEPLGASGEGWATIQSVFDGAAVLLAFEQIGGADRTLEMGRDYALERMAFGRPIGSFQAIKHMLADMYVSAALARSNAYYGAWALSSGAAELPIAAPTARVSATMAFQQCAKNNIQVHGGMGFTWAFDCHLFYRRSNALALVLGSLATWEDLLIERMHERNDLAAAG
jgi:acyl-CoA dehydrogenase